MSIGEGIRTSASRPRAAAHLQLRSSGWLWAAGGISLLGYLALFVTLHLKSIAWADAQVLTPLTGYWEFFYRNVFSASRVTASAPSTLAAQHPLLLIGTIAILAAGYVLTLLLIRALPEADRPGLRVLTALAIVFSIPLLLLPNLLSTDVYSYISFGRIATLHGGNPFIDPPGRFPYDLYLQWVSWSDVPSVYGPVWIHLSLLLTVLVERIWSHPIAYVLTYKLLALLLHLLNGAMIWGILWHWRPSQRAWGTALYLLNPLALIEFVGNAHNDALMITLILAGILFHLRGRWLQAAALFTLAVLTKWIALPLLPLYGLLLLGSKRSLFLRAKYVAGLAGVFVALSVGLYVPYWEGPATLKILLDAPPQKRFINSLGQMFVDEVERTMYAVGRWPNPLLKEFLPRSPLVNTADPLEEIEGPSWQTRQQMRLQRDQRDLRIERAEVARHERALQNAVRWFGLGWVLCACLLGALLTRGLRTMLLATAWIFFTYITIGAVWFWPWYATWFVALAAVLDWRITGRTAVLLSLLALLIYPFFPSVPVPSLPERFRALIVFGPPLLFAGYHFVRLLRGYARREWRLADLSRMD